MRDPEAGGCTMIGSYTRTFAGMHYPVMHCTVKQLFGTGSEATSARGLIVLREQSQRPGGPDTR